MQLFFGLSVWWSDSKVGNRIKTRSGSRPYPLRGMVDAGDDTISKVRIRRANPARGEQSSRNSGGVLLVRRVTPAHATHWTRSRCVLPCGLCRPRKPSPAALPSLRENGAVSCLAKVPHAEHWARRGASVLRAGFASQRGRCADGRRDDTSSRVVCARIAPSDAWSDVLDQGGSQGRCRARHLAEDPSSGTTPTACEVPFTRTPARAPTSVQAISQRACPGCARR